MEELEIKFLNIDVADTERRLVEAGAQKVGDYHYRRIVFDYPDYRLDAKGSFVRLRDEGDKITLAYKERLGMENGGDTGNDAGMYEREVAVSDFEATRDIFLKAGFVEKMYQENKRTRYTLSGVECDIDTWPLIPTYIELEGSNWDDIYAVAAQLGFNKDDAKLFTANQVYKLNGLDDRNYTKLTFDEQIERTENRF